MTSEGSKETGRETETSEPTAHEERTEIDSKTLGPAIRIYRDLIPLTGSINAALMLSQGLYWSRRTGTNNGAFYKSRDEWTNETGLTHEQQESARKRLRRLGFWHERNDRTSHRVFYRIDEAELRDQLNENPDLKGRETRHERTVKHGEGEPGNTASLTVKDGKARRDLRRGPPGNTVPVEEAVTTAVTISKTSKPPGKVSSHSERGLKFADWFRSTLPDKFNLPKNYRDQWAQTFDDLIRIDGHTAEEIHAVCKWARSDQFWSGQFLSPAKLRKRKDGVTYYDSFVAKSKKGGGHRTPAASPNSGTKSRFSPGGNRQ